MLPAAMAGKMQLACPFVLHEPCDGMPAAQLLLRSGQRWDVSEHADCHVFICRIGPLLSVHRLCPLLSLQTQCL